VGLVEQAAAAVVAVATLDGRLDDRIDPKFGTDGLCLALLAERRLCARSTTAM